MSKWKVIAPLGVLAAAGAAAAAVLLKKKDGGSAPKAAAPAAKKAAERETLMKTGEYSFVSGFKDARTVEVRLDYDALRFGFDVIGEDFLTYSSDSHVAVVSGEDFSFQMEYASFYKGEDFALITSAAAQKYACFCLPVDEYSYLLLTLLKAEGCDKTVEELAESDDLGAILSTLRVEAK